MVRYKPDWNGLGSYLKPDRYSYASPLTARPFRGDHPLAGHDREDPVRARTREVGGGQSEAGHFRLARPQRADFLEAAEGFEG